MPVSEGFQYTPPSLPKGGGAITGMGERMGESGPDGVASISLPLPVSEGRGYAPALSLVYSNQAGNGVFGMGWSLPLAAIHRRTNKGVPAYLPSDEFQGPEGEVLVPALSDDGAPLSREESTLLGEPLGQTYRVTTWRARVERSFSRFEYWVAQASDEQDFWLMYQPDGQVHLLGKNAASRLCNPQDTTQTAAWLIESSVSMTGEQIHYQYRAENNDNCDADELSAHPDASAQRYLVAVHYGNMTPGRVLPGIGADDPLTAGWLFCLVLDYGERSLALADMPPWETSGTWLTRQDCMSGYEYGFDLRTRRLCRQIMMYHRTLSLSGMSEGEDTPELVSRLMLSYQETPSVTTLTAARTVGYEKNDGAATMAAMPPLEFAWEAFIPPSQPQWQQRDDLGNLNPFQPWQLVDLRGEGIPGVLYLDQNAWWYREPVRQENPEDVNAVTWTTASPLPRIPALNQGARLADLNGDGRPEWVVTAGVVGYYDSTPSRDWLNFTPLSALPVEYAHPDAELINILSSHFSDLVMVGPRSVRLYAGKDDGWDAGKTVLQAEGIILPVSGRNAARMVGFSDMLGSGQQHLVQISADAVTCWPNLGGGHFGHPVPLPGFSQPALTFNPQQLYLADVDGSGTADIIYAHADRLEIYLNQCGNRFAAPFTIPLPEGVRYDRTCQLQVTDLQGLGVASVLLSCPHPIPRHWVCHLSVQKPWLLTAVNNNMGAHYALRYRSAVQFWLDEKAACQAAGLRAPACYLPFPLHVLWQTVSEDEITGNRLAQGITYRKGVWDGREREFRGFAYVESCDSVTDASRGTAAEFSMPAVVRSWFATGVPEVDEILPDMFWQGDEQASPAFTPRFTTGCGESETAFTPEGEAHYWLSRALKGTPLRTEVYGADNSEAVSVPYAVTENRPQVRLVEGRGEVPVAWTTVVERREYAYERVTGDPQCSQQVLLASDEYGAPLRQVTINYPRRAKPAASPYPDTLPETLFDSSYDEQQQVLRLMLQQRSWHNLVDAEVYIPGLANGTRSDVFSYPDGEVPDGGLTLESLLESDGLTGDGRPRLFSGQQQVWYLDAQNAPAQQGFLPQALVAYTESAVLDEDITAQLTDYVTPQQLEAAGYYRSDCLFARPEEKQVWVMRAGYTDYATAAHFWKPVAVRDTALTGKWTITWDAHDCAIIQYRDAASLTTRIGYDYRFMTPVIITDENDNEYTVTLDALGRVTSSRFRGTENGEMTGYSGPDEEAGKFIPPVDMDTALSLTAPLPVSRCLTYMTDSWMSRIHPNTLPQDAEGDYQTLRKAGLLTEDGYLSAMLRHDSVAASRYRDGVARLSAAATALTPPHTLTLMTDRYDSDPMQQIRQQVVFSDGFGRLLQAGSRQVPGEALQRKDDGSLVTDDAGAPLPAPTDFRWAVTGRTEFNNKGLSIRTYQPYFLNDWRYVRDDSARQELWADSSYYDPLNRMYQVVTAKGFVKRVLVTPWFTVTEDENDTLP